MLGLEQVRAGARRPYTGENVTLFGHASDPLVIARRNRCLRAEPRGGSSAHRATVCVQGGLGGVWPARLD